MGVVAMFGSLLVLLTVPLLDVSRVRGAQFRPLHRLAFWILVADFIVLTIIGANHPEDPFIFVGQAATALYFAWFLLIVPALGALENTMMDIALEEKPAKKASRI
jgi:ubiquinol-cytochrome c reductase cytochrome b subunit